MDKEKNTILLRELNRFTRREHTLDEVYLFDLILCDNDVDREGDAFTDEALSELQKRFIGVTGIFDHDTRSGNQNARIFHTEVVTDSQRKNAAGKPYRYLKANAYMVRTEGNADLIREIEAGIKKEVSISCAVSKKTCSICGENQLRKTCAHRKGRQYAGKLCYCALEGITDAYEWSFVAVPAQRGAGVTKTLGAASCDPEKAALRRELEETQDLLELLTEDLRHEVVRLCYRDGESACSMALAESTPCMSVQRLLALRQSLLQGRKATAAQLTGAPYAEKAVLPYQMEEKEESPHAGMWNAHR